MDTLAVICPLRVEGETSDAWNQRLDKSAKRTHNLLIGNQKGPWIITDCSGKQPLFCFQIIGKFFTQENSMLPPH